MAKQTAVMNEATTPLSLAGKLLAIARDIAGTKMTGKNNHDGFKYYTEKDLTDALRGACLAHSVYVQTSVVEQKILGDLTLVRLRHDLINVETGEERTAFSEGQGVGKPLSGGGFKDDGTAVKKAMTGAFRYFIKQNFLVSDSLEDDETDVGKFGDVVNTQGNTVNARQAATDTARAREQASAPTTTAAPKTEAPRSNGTNGSGAKKLARPMTPDTLLAEYKRVSELDKSPISLDMAQKISGIWRHAFDGNREIAKMIGQFFGINSYTDITAAGLNFLFNWCKTAEHEDGSVEIEPMAMQELEAIHSRMVDSVTGKVEEMF